MDFNSQKKRTWERIDIANNFGLWIDKKRISRIALI